VKEINIDNQYKKLILADNSIINTKSIVITTGVDYRKHPAKNIEKLTGAGIYYGAANTEAHACSEQDVYIVGGGNSAGQAAVYLSRFAKNVFICIRKDSLTATMSNYLIDQLNEIESIELLPKTNILEVVGVDNLEKIVTENLESKEHIERPASALFIFIGAKPMTEWLPEGISTNEKGFVETGNELKHDTNFSKSWKKERDPFMLETSIPGIFSAGDVRSGAMNRVASAVGEGAMAIKFVHEYLAES
jgi:thioredoxin reductase (NADPH)